MRSPPHLLALAVAAGLTALLGGPALAQGAAKSQVEHGAYLVRAGDCVSCHTAPGGKPFAGGLATNTGFGIVYSPNLTPDKETGIGNWSAEQFYRAKDRGFEREIAKRLAYWANLRKERSP